MYRPTTTILATSPGAASQQQGTGGAKKNSYARVIGSAAAGVSELLLFHPVDTVAKRLMSNRAVAVKGQPAAEAMATFNQVTCVAFGTTGRAAGLSEWHRANIQPKLTVASVRTAVASEKVWLTEVRRAVRCAVTSNEAGAGPDNCKRSILALCMVRTIKHITDKQEYYTYEKTRRSCSCATHRLALVGTKW